MSSLYQSAKYTKSATSRGNLPPELGFEVAFAGRSNSGKSSTLNRLCRQKSLARTSKTPGRTQMINFFSIPDGRYLVDLPGYGYAKVPPKLKEQWRQFIEYYLLNRFTLRGLVILMDIRHPLKEGDWTLIKWAENRRLPLHLILNKADKLKRGAIAKQLAIVKKELKTFNPNNEISIQTFSALKGDGLSVLEDKLNSWLIFDELDEIIDS